MSDWKKRLTETLEPALRELDPRMRISAYHDMPYAIFRYPPEDEFALRAEISLLKTRLEQAGKRVTCISLAECMAEALRAEGIETDSLIEAETTVGLDAVIQTVHNVLSEYQPLDKLVATKIPEDYDPLRDIVFIYRAGALFPLYRTSSLLEQLKGKVHVPCILFYPGVLDGAAGLCFMGVLDAEHNYRPRIF
ncbi:MAG: BREX protein BrxB domain-containing protein [Syntrophobacteraceae bacterium]